MTKNRRAVIDIGTNTLNLLIAEVSQKDFDITHKDKVFTFLGRDSTKGKALSEEAQNRLFRGLEALSKTLELYKIHNDKTAVVATSALRQAKNTKDLIKKVQDKYGFQIQIIEGKQEAEYVYFGVRTALDIGEENALIVDIGAGSVEFIICNQRKLLWKDSFEIGGQVLLDNYKRSDPMSHLDVQRLEIFLESKLFAFSNAIFNYNPKKLIGASGVFDTIATVSYMLNQTSLKDFADKFHELKVKSYTLTKEDFQEVYQELIRKDRSQRSQIEGLLKERIDLIVPATCLVDFLIERYDLELLQVSAYGLKEGVLVKNMS